MTDHDTDVVASLRSALADRMGRERYELWFGSGASLVLSGHRVGVEAPNQFKLDLLRKNFRADIEAAATRVLDKAPVIEFRVAPSRVAGRVSDGKNDSNATRSAASATEKGATRRTSQRRDARRQGNTAAAGSRRFAKFDSFIVGESNRLAFKSAQLVTQQLGAYSPLFVSGPPGVGKTHLLEGLWSAVRRRSGGRRAVFLSAEQFTNYFLDALKGSGLPSFRRRYRDVDLLIIDDVQFFREKKATIIELLHTADTLLREGRQLVFAADRNPAQLPGLGEQLITRLSGGLVCGIGPLDQATRFRLLRRWAGQRAVQVDDKVLRAVAASAVGDARQLSGALNRLHVTGQALGTSITAAMAAEALSDLMGKQGRAVGLPDIERAVCDAFGLAPRSLQSEAKAKRVNQPRMLAMWLARKHTRAALSEISQYFGRRSHSTAVSAQRKVNQWLADGEAVRVTECACSVRDMVQQIEQHLRTG